MKNYDGIIIGFGKAGKTLAGDLANQGKKIALIEKSAQMYGGTCINVACIPSKSLVKSAKLSKDMQLIKFEEKEKRYKSAIEEKHVLTSMLREKNYNKLNNNENVTIYNGKGSFISHNQVKVEMEDETLILQGDKIFINTGSRSLIPEISGIGASKKVYTSETLLELRQLPERLAIIGGGPIGLEFASIYANFGSKVTVFVNRGQVLSREDKDISYEVEKVLMEKGIDFKMNAKVESILDVENEAIISYVDNNSDTEYQYKADGVLIATGRKPNIKDLNLRAAGVELGPDGGIKVDEYLKTSNKNIWAMGDVNGGPQFTYISLDDYRIVKSQLTKEEDKLSIKNRINVPSTLFIDPAYSRVGLNEKEARDLGYEIKIVKLPASAIPKAQVLQSPEGILKAIIDLKTNKILGAMLFCEESYEVINVIKLAMDAGLPYTFLRDQIYTHPTMTESLNDLFNV